MPTRRGRGGRTAGAGRGHGGVAQDGGSAVVADDLDNTCGLCSSLQVGGEAVDSDEFPLWFHPSPQCMGISEASIPAVCEGDLGGLKYVCTKCRVERQPGGGEDNTAIVTQLFTTVLNLAASVGSLLQQLSGLA